MCIVFDLEEHLETRISNFVQLGVNASKYQIICRFVATFGNSTQEEYKRGKSFILNYPGWHDVGLRRPVVVVEDHHGEHHAAGHHHHDAVEVCAWNIAGVLRINYTYFWFSY